MIKEAIPLERSEQLADIDIISNKPQTHGVLIFKHSTRCSVSHFALRGLKVDWHFAKDKLPLYFLDLIKHRELSNQIANKYEVKHESPQILFIKNGVCLGNASHNSVSVDTIETWIND